MDSLHDNSLVKDEISQTQQNPLSTTDDIGIEIDGNDFVELENKSLTVLKTPMYS